MAEATGMDPRRTLHTDEGGNYPMALLNRACREIQAGTSDRGWVDAALSAKQCEIEP